jgi:integrase
VAFCRRRGWLAADVVVGVDRRREPADRTRAIPYVQLERLWRRSDVAVREKALWRLLYETAARASEVLSLDVGDVDLENRRAVVRSKGGDVELLHFQTGSARLLPRLIGVPTTSLRETTPSVSRRRGQRRAAAQARGEGPRQALEPRVPARLGRPRGSHVPRGLRRLGTCGRERALSALQRLPAQSSSD